MKKRTIGIISVTALSAIAGYYLVRDSHYVSNRAPSSPAQLRLSDWKVVLKNTFGALGSKDLGMLAAGVAYFATLAFFPTVLATAAIYGLVVGPAALASSMSQVAVFLPGSLAHLLKGLLDSVTHSSLRTLGFAAVISFAILVVSASGGTENLIKATNIAYDVEESRSFIKIKLLSLAMTIAGLFFGCLILALLIVNTSSLQGVGLPHAIASVIKYARWPILVLLLSLALAIVYRYCPNRSEPKWQWVSWGSTAATIIWLVGTVVFFYYMQHFANLGKTYGTFAGLVLLMMWLNLSILVILVGAQVNRQLEQRTRANTFEQ